MKRKTTFLVISDEKKVVFFPGNLDIIKKCQVIGALASEKSPGSITRPNVCGEGKWFIPT